MWLRTLILWGTAFLSVINANGFRDGAKCYDCNYDPRLVPEVTSAVIDWAGIPDRGYPRCSLHPTVDADLVADTLCQSTCFIRRDSNGLVYRGCADPWNLPYQVDTSVNCTRKDDGSIWWFCTGSRCNRGTFGKTDICPGNYDDFQNDVAYGNPGSGQIKTVRVASGKFPAFTGNRNNKRADATSEQDKLDPYLIMESGWQAYGRDVEPKTASKDEYYTEPSPSGSTTGEYGPRRMQTLYKNNPSLSVDVYRVHALKNPEFSEQYKSLIPAPGHQTTNAFGPPEHLLASAKTVKQGNVYSNGYKSSQSNQYMSSGRNSEQVKSAYVNANPITQWYQRQPVVLYQPLPQAKSGPDYNSVDGRSYIIAYTPAKSHSGSAASGYVRQPLTAGNTKSISGYASVPKNAYAQTLTSVPKRSSGLYDKRAPSGGSHWSPSGMRLFYVPQTYQGSVNAFVSESKSKRSRSKSDESSSKWYERWAKAGDSGSEWLRSQRTSRKASAEWQDSQNYQRHSMMKGHTSQKKQGQAKAGHKSYLSDVDRYQEPNRFYAAGTTNGVNYFNAKELPDYGDFWYENKFLGNRPLQPGYDAVPITLINPCDGDCSRNPSGLYPHPESSDWFIQCGAGVSESGDNCICCKPNYLRCPDGTLFDVTTRVCSTIRQSEYGYRPIV